MLNVIGQTYLDGKQRNLPALLKSIGDEITDHVEFVNEVMEMTENELLDLGFDYLNEYDDFMLIPAWLLPLIPEGTLLYSVDGRIFELNDNADVALYGDNWINAGFLQVCEDGACVTYRNINGGCPVCGEPAF